jgi:hypothetical protein
MVIEQTKEGLLIKTTASYDIKTVQRIIDYMTVLEITAQAQGTQEQADELASEVNKKWWAENKSKFIR